MDESSLAQREEKRNRAPPVNDVQTATDGLPDKDERAARSESVRARASLAMRQPSNLYPASQGYFSTASAIRAIWSSVQRTFRRVGLCSRSVKAAQASR